MVHLLHLKDALFLENFKSAFTIVFGVKGFVDLAKVSCANEVQNFEVRNARFFQFFGGDGGGSKVC